MGFSPSCTAEGVSCTSQLCGLERLYVYEALSGRCGLPTSPGSEPSGSLGEVRNTSVMMFGVLVGARVVYSDSDSETKLPRTFVYTSTLG
jgi:hypothetical protein